MTAERRSQRAATESRQMQHAPDRDGQSAGHALRVILLQTGNCFANLDRINAVNRPAIITEPRQIALKRANIGRRCDQLPAALEIVKRPPYVARRKVSVVHCGAALMEKPPFIPRSKRIFGMKKWPVEEYVLKVGAGSERAQHNAKQNQDRLFHDYLVLIGALPKGRSGGGNCFSSMAFGGQSGQ